MFAISVILEFYMVKTGVKHIKSTVFTCKLCGSEMTISFLFRAESKSKRWENNGSDKMFFSFYYCVIKLKIWNNYQNNDCIQFFPTKHDVYIQLV